MASQRRWILTHGRIPFIVAEGGLSNHRDLDGFRDKLRKTFQQVVDVLNEETYLIWHDSETHSKVVCQCTCAGAVALIYFPDNLSLQDQHVLSQYLNPIGYSLKILNEELENIGGSPIILNKICLDITEKQTN